MDCVSLRSVHDACKEGRALFYFPLVFSGGRVARAASCQRRPAFLLVDRSMSSSIRMTISVTSWPSSLDCSHGTHISWTVRHWFAHMGGTRQPFTVLVCRTLGMTNQPAVFAPSVGQQKYLFSSLLRGLLKKVVQREAAVHLLTHLSTRADQHQPVDRGRPSYCHLLRHHCDHGIPRWVSEELSHACVVQGALPPNDRPNT